MLGVRLGAGGDSAAEELGGCLVRHNSSGTNRSEDAGVASGLGMHAMAMNRSRC